MWTVVNIVDRGGLDTALICRFPAETGVGKGARPCVCVDTRPNKRCLEYSRTHGVKKLPKIKIKGFPGGAVVEGLPANAGDTGSSPGLGGSHMPRSD